MFVPTTAPPTPATHEVYAAAHAGTYKGACRLCRYATGMVPKATATKRVEHHVATRHGVTPTAAA